MKTTPRQALNRAGTEAAVSAIALASMRCVPCETARRLGLEEAESILKELPGWEVHGDSIEKGFRFKSYRAGLEFAYTIGKVAEEQDHHPTILIEWRKVKLSFSTHVVNGLSMNDFVMAAKSELEFAKQSLR